MQGLMGLIDSQMAGPNSQQIEEGLAGLIKGNAQAPAALGGLSQAAVPSDRDMQLAMSILGQNQESAPAATPTGGMFDAYSSQNQTNLQMAMLADIAGNVMGKDVGAMKTVMPYVENARKLRLQQEENAAFNKMVEGMSPEMQAIARNAPKSLQNTIMQGYISNMNQAKPVTGGKTKIGPNGALLQLMSDGSWKKVSGAPAKGNTTIIGGKPSLLDTEEAKTLGAAKKSMFDGVADARNRLRPQLVMRSLLSQKDADGKYVLKTGAFKALALPMQQMWNSIVDSVATPELANQLAVGNTSYAEIFQSNEKAAALISAALMKGNLSEKELQFSQDIQAMFAKTRGANIVLTELSIMRERSRIAEAEHMNDWELNLDPIKWARGDGTENVNRLNALWRKELQRYRANDAQQLNDAFMQDMWSNLGYVNLSGGGYKDVTKYTADQLKAMSPTEQAAVLKAMKAKGGR
jgi:hypothetical protein